MSAVMTAHAAEGAGDKLIGGNLIGGAYEVIEPLDSGALGVVYVARQAHLGRKVAIKLIREPYACNPQFTGSLLREARAGCLIEHPNVARTYDFGYDDDGRCFLVMELLRGQPLVKVIERVPRPPAEWTVSIVAQVLAGLAAAHDRGVIHRDVKPENIIIQTTIGDDGQPMDLAKICDFGIASVPECDILDEQGRPLTFEGRMCGTPNYMSPEQAQGLPLEPQTDIYSTGVLLFELATGRLPFYDATLMGLAEKHVREDPPRPREFNPDIDAALERIILRAMAKRPEARYPSARAMRAALLDLDCAARTTSLLEDWADGPSVLLGVRRSDAWRFEPTLVDETTRFERKLRRKRRATAAALATCAAVLCASFAWRHLPEIRRWWSDLNVATSALHAPPASAEVKSASSTDHAGANAGEPERSVTALRSVAALRSSSLLLSPAVPECAAPAFADDLGGRAMLDPGQHLPHRELPSAGDGWYRASP